MKTYLFPPASMRRLLPEQRGRPAPWIVGLMTFVSVVVGVLGVSVYGTVFDLSEAAAGRWSLQVTGSADDAGRAGALLRASPAVKEISQVPESELRDILGDWLGPAADQLELPLPALSEVTLAPGSDGAALAAQLSRQVPAARLTPYSAELAPLLKTLRNLVLLIGALLIVLAAALAGAVTLAARASLEANRGTLDVLHGIGATDEQLLALLQRRIGIDVLAGGGAGALAAAAVLAIVLVPARDLLGGPSGIQTFATSSLALLLFLPLAQAALAILVARRALKTSLAEGA